MSTEIQPQASSDGTSDVVLEDISLDFLNEVSDESLVAQISANRTGMDVPMDPDLVDPTVSDTPPPGVVAEKKGIVSAEKSKGEPLNFANLRKAREAAERERDQLREERDSLLQKAQEADMTRAEKAELAEQLEKTRSELMERTEAITRVNARETPEYKQVYNLYQEGWKQINGIVNSDALKDSGVQISAQALLQNDRAAINNAIRGLQEAGDYASANDLQQTLSAMNVWRTDLQQIEQKSVTKAQAWTNNREYEIARSVMQAQLELAQEVPYMDFKSSAFLGMPDNQQMMIKKVHEEATLGVKQVLESASNPGQLSTMAYRNAVVVRAQAMELEGLKQALPAKDAEIAKLQKELAAYQKAAGSALPSGSNRTSVKSSGGGVDAEEEFEELMAALNSMG